MVLVTRPRARIGRAPASLAGRLPSLAVVALALALSTLVTTVYGQWNDGWYRHPPRYATDEDLVQGAFTFCRLHYTSVRNEQLGHGWNTDYPNSDFNFMIRLAQLTRAQVNIDDDGEPTHVVVRATDDLLFSCPFVFMSDVGTTGFDDLEVDRLRDYLLAGGFLYVDDFWGDEAWQHWSAEIGK